MDTISIRVESTPRQTFGGMGASIFPWMPAKLYRKRVPEEQTAAMAGMLWRDAHFTNARLWMIPEEYAPAPGKREIRKYVDGYFTSGKLFAATAAGAKLLVLAPDRLPAYMGDGHGYIADEQIAPYATLLANFIADFKAATGILINRSGLLNEPNDRPIRLKDEQWPVMIKAYRAALDAAGLGEVGIVAPESANCGEDAYRIVKAINADPAARAALTGFATHSYNNAATPEMAALTAGKEYWITEAGGMTDSDEDVGNTVQAASASARFLNDMNHGATHWQFFIGAEEADPRGNTARILKYSFEPFRLTVLRKYDYFHALTDAFETGAVFRHAVSSVDHEMTYTYGRKPRLNTAAARNPDGTWGIALCNFTADYFVDPDAPAWYRKQGGVAGRAFGVHISMPELAVAGTIHFEGRRLAGGSAAASIEQFEMKDGELWIPELSSLELLTLRSKP